MAVFEHAIGSHNRVGQYPVVVILVAPDNRPLETVLPCDSLCTVHFEPVGVRKGYCVNVEVPEH